MGCTDDLECKITCVVTGVVLSFSIAKVAVGATHYDDCLLEPMVPIFLIVSACLPLLFSQHAWRRIRDTDDESSGISLIVSVVAVICSFAWLIAGTVWVAPTYNIVKSEDGCLNTTTIGQNNKSTTIGGVAAIHCISCDGTLITFAEAIVRNENQMRIIVRETRTRQPHLILDVFPRVSDGQAPPPEPSGNHTKHQIGVSVVTAVRCELKWRTCAVVFHMKTAPVHYE
ncbi:hypothetical protein ScPMuIL_007230 [Solemya velum]